jgi:hypothetical protein
VPQGPTPAEIAAAAAQKAAADAAAATAARNATITAQLTNSGYTAAQIAALGGPQKALASTFLKIKNPTAGINYTTGELGGAVSKAITANPQVLYNGIALSRYSPDAAVNAARQDPVLFAMLQPYLPKI